MQSAEITIYHPNSSRRGYTLASTQFLWYTQTHTLFYIHIYNQPNNWALWWVQAKSPHNAWDDIHARNTEILSEKHEIQASHIRPPPSCHTPSHRPQTFSIPTALPSGAAGSRSIGIPADTKATTSLRVWTADGWGNQQPIHFSKDLPCLQGRSTALLQLLFTSFLQLTNPSCTNTTVIYIKVCERSPWIWRREKQHAINLVLHIKACQLRPSELFSKLTLVSQDLVWTAVGLTPSYMAPMGQARMSPAQWSSKSTWDKSKLAFIHSPRPQRDLAMS